MDRVAGNLGAFIPSTAATMPQFAARGQSFSVYGTDSPAAAARPQYGYPSHTLPANFQPG